MPTVYRDGVAYTDGAMHVAIASGSTIPSPTFTGTVSGAVGVLSVSGIHFIKPSSGSMGNNGAVSGLTALPRTYAGAYMWFAADQIAAGVPAGWYWFVASGTQAGTVYNSTYSSGVPAVGTATAFATTGPGAFTGVTTAVTAVSVTLPANTLGINGRLMVSADYLMAATAGAKAATVTLGGSNIFNASTLGSSQATATARGFLTNEGVTNRQTIGRELLLGGSSTSDGTVTGAGLTLDTTGALTIAFTLTTSGAATDHLILASHLISYARQ